MQQNDVIHQMACEARKCFNALREFWGIYERRRALEQILRVGVTEAEGASADSLQEHEILVRTGAVLLNDLYRCAQRGRIEAAKVWVYFMMDDTQLRDYLTKRREEGYERVMKWVGGGNNGECRTN